MTRRILMVLLSVGVVAGYGSVFVHARRDHRHGYGHCHRFSNAAP